MRVSCARACERFDRWRRSGRGGGPKEGVARANSVSPPTGVIRTIAVLKADPLSVVRPTAGARGVSARVRPTAKGATAGSPPALLTPRRRRRQYPGRGGDPRRRWLTVAVSLLSCANEDGPPTCSVEGKNIFFFCD